MLRQKKNWRKHYPKYFKALVTNGIREQCNSIQIAHWLAQKSETLDLAAIAYLDGEKHVRVAMAMDDIMQYVSEHKADSSLMFMCTPTDVYAVPEEVISASVEKFQQRSQGQKYFG